LTVFLSLQKLEGNGRLDPAVGDLKGTDNFGYMVK
jgi:hypothetical protein